MDACCDSADFESLDDGIIVCKNCGYVKEEEHLVQDMAVASARPSGDGVVMPIAKRLKVSSGFKPTARTLKAGTTNAAVFILMHLQSYRTRY